ncbi:MAG: hypothetical protein IKZ19_02410 [Clostridia bacterium]|nr:hypothetical protein [Clostridia bacterium]
MKTNYTGKATPVRATLQRLALLWPMGENPEKEAELKNLKFAPLSDCEAKRLPDYLPADSVTAVLRDGEKLWIGTNEGLWLIDEKNPEPLDRVLCFRACAFLCDNAVKAVDTDGDNGVWVLTETGLAHIAMRAMSMKHKAELFSEIHYKYHNRRGMLAGADWDAEKKTFRGSWSDNDGLWTALFAMGDLCRYAVLRDEGKASAEELKRARELAVLWTEACLLLAYIPGWKGTVPAVIRYNNPGNNKSSKAYLKQGGNPDFGVPANGPVGMVEYTPQPVVPSDWAESNAMPEIVFRNVEGYIARSYHVNSPDDEPDYDDGVFMRKKFNPEGKLISIRVPSETWKGDDIPNLYSIDSSMPIPDRLRRLYTDCGYGDDDITYKCDTSNDELVGHYAIWHLAYDILGEEDPELAEIIRVIAERHAQHLLDNDFCHTDCGGQPTSWARMNRSYYMNRGSYGIADAPLGTSILLQCFKVAYHVSKNEKWEKVYRMLALEEPYRYADLLSEYYDRYAKEARDAASYPLTEEETFRAVVANANYSDIRMSAVAYYTLGQLETDPILLEKYRAGAASWWKFLKYSRDVEWCLTWQLMNPNEEQRDAFGRTCSDMLAWQLSHFPINARIPVIDNRTRPGVIAGTETLWYDENTPCSLNLEERGSGGSSVYACVGGHNTKYGICLGTYYNMNMNYWLGRYNGLLTDDCEDGDVTLADIEEVLFNGLK